MNLLDLYNVIFSKIINFKMSVKVAVRLRPFNPRETELGSKLIIEMNNNTTKIKDPESGDKRDFTFDYSFWSHDGFETTDDVIF